MLAYTTRQKPFIDAVSGALSSIEEEQLATGEIPNYRKSENGSWEYCFSPLVSTYVSDALAIFDPRSRWFDPLVVEQTGESYSFALSRRAANLRRRIQQFVAWQQSADGDWRFLGRGSSLPADLDTTACCALALLDRISVNGDAGSRRFARSFDGFAKRGALSTSAGSRGFASDSDETVTLVANANVLCYLALTGASVEALAAEIVRLCEGDGARSTASLPIMYVLGEVWRKCRLPSLQALVSTSIGSLTECQTTEGTFGGLCSTAMGLTALLDFGYEGPAVARAAGWLRDWMESSSVSIPEEFCDSRCASPALATAVAIAALCRTYSWTNDE
jgi:hypothetical protein